MPVNDFNAESGSFNQGLNPKNRFKVLTSAAGAAGSATPTLTLTGLKATDTIVSVQQKTKGANNLPLLGWTTQADNALTCVYSADPGAGCVVVVTVLR